MIYDPVEIEETSIVELNPRGLVCKISFPCVSNKYIFSIIEEEEIWIFVQEGFG